MAIAQLPGADNPTPEEEVDTGSQIKENTQINDVAPSTTPWVDSVAGYKDPHHGYGVDGSPCYGNYYQQLRELGDVGDTIDARIDSAYQQYSKIHNYRGMLRGSLNYQTDPESKESQLTGELVIVDALIPNRGDLWVMERGYGRLGLFAVTNTERLSPFKNSAYTATIVLIEESDESTPSTRLAALESKVVGNFYYDENYLYLGTSPTLTSEQLEQFESRKLTAERLSYDYLREFYYRPAGTLVLDLNGGLVYDQHLTQFVSKTFRIDVGMVRLFNEQQGIPRATLWDELIRRRRGSHGQVMSKMWLVNTLKNQDLQFLYSLHHTPINFILREKELSIPPETVYLGYGTSTQLSYIDLAQLTEISPPATSGNVQPTPTVGYLGDYVLSTAWYSGEGEVSVLEEMVNDWFNNRPLDPAKVDLVINASVHFTALERYYLYPIIIFLLNIR